MRLSSGNILPDTANQPPAPPHTPQVVHQHHQPQPMSLPPPPPPPPTMMMYHQPPPPPPPQARYSVNYGLPPPMQGYYDMYGTLHQTHPMYMSQVSVVI